MRNVSNESCRENQSTHFTVNNFFPENRAVSEIVSENMADTDRPQMTIQLCAEKMRIECRITKATNTHSYVIKVR